MKIYINFSDTITLILLFIISYIYYNSLHNVKHNSHTQKDLHDICSNKRDLLKIQHMYLKINNNLYCQSEIQSGQGHCHEVCLGFHGWCNSILRLFIR